MPLVVLSDRGIRGEAMQAKARMRQIDRHSAACRTNCFSILKWQQTGIRT
jgi:hypothetical protein